MIVFKTKMKELPKSCNDCELFDKMCKLSFKTLRYKKERYKYCPLLVMLEPKVTLDNTYNENENWNDD